MLMISPDYFSNRWGNCQAMLNNHLQPSDCCRIETAYFPIHSAAEDGLKKLPYALHPELQQRIAAALLCLQDYTKRYMLRGEKISAHKLPPLSLSGRALMAHLRKQNPHLPRDLLHHWCANPCGGTALLELCEGVWEQGWAQSEHDCAPWAAAINMLLLKIIRAEIATISKEHIELTSHVFVCIVGTLYAWALSAFLKRQFSNPQQRHHATSYENMLLPATPMLFMQLQSDASLLAEDSNILRLYGLEPEIVTRLRELRTRLGINNHAEILQLLTQDKIGAHLQCRSWARLSLWKLAIDTQQAGWMEYVFNPKQLDHLLAGKVKPSSTMLEQLKNQAEQPIAHWLLLQLQGGTDADEPWRHDSSTLIAFFAFDEDVKIELARRKSAPLWQAFKAADTSAKRNNLADTSNWRQSTNIANTETSSNNPVQQMQRAWQDGEIILLQTDFSASLRSGTNNTVSYGILRVAWAEYLNTMQTSLEKGLSEFISTQFSPGVVSLLTKHKALYLDSYSASGCLLRGPVVALAETAIRLQEQLAEWLSENSDKLSMAPKDASKASMFLTLADEWCTAEQLGKDNSKLRIAFSPALIQAEAGCSHSSTVAQLIEAHSKKLNLLPLTSVAIENITDLSGNTLHLLYNGGIALTVEAIAALKQELADKADICEFQFDELKLKPLLYKYRMPSVPIELSTIHPHQENSPPWQLVKIGKAHLAGHDTLLFELMSSANPLMQYLKKEGLLPA
ncbi:MAG: hypothetical protein Q9M31_09200 [Mariprofundus sp.]|nr:hypothetical protein [Mariprofundus sp.]